MSRLRERVVPGLGRLSPPVWATDPDFDLAYHVRRLCLPEPGSMRQLLDLAAAVAATPLDRSRPLWEFTIGEGLEGGRAAGARVDPRASPRLRRFSREASAQTLRRPNRRRTSRLTPTGRALAKAWGICLPILTPTVGSAPLHALSK